MSNRRLKEYPSCRSTGKNCVIAALLAAVLSLAVLNRAEPAPEHSAETPHPAVTAEDTVVPSPAAEEDAGFALDSPVITVSVGGEPVRMELEDYLVGVVAAEMPVSAEPAALQAQAVAARTFTAQHMCGGAKCAHGCEGCTVCDDPACCQAYAELAELSAAWGNNYEANIKKIRDAVDSTRSLIVLYGGRPICAAYHASSGKATENSEAVFAAALPYLVSVDSYEGDTSRVTVQEFDESELVSIIDRALPDAGLSVPLAPGDIDVWGRTDSGRVQLVRLGATVVTGQQLRTMLGLRSTAFTVEISGGRVSFTCTGYGHGVGMSQYGAMEMASEGFTFAEILLHYYTGTELGKLTYGT